VAAPIDCPRRKAVDEELHVHQPKAPERDVGAAAPAAAREVEAKESNSAQTKIGNEELPFTLRGRIAVQVDHARAGARQLGGRKSGDRASQSLAPITRIADRMSPKRMVVWPWEEPWNVSRMALVAWRTENRVNTQAIRAIIRKAEWEYLREDW
jgi:hypothetical protein